MASDTSERRPFLAVVSRDSVLWVKWIVRTVPVTDLQWALNELQRDYRWGWPQQPIISYVDQSRVIISWPYRRYYAPEV